MSDEREPALRDQAIRERAYPIWEQEGPPNESESGSIGAHGRRLQLDDRKPVKSRLRGVSQKVNYLLLAIPLAVVVTFTAFADDQSAKETAPTFKPRLSGIMSVTQFLQYKLWYAGRAQNWALANYEATRLKEGIQDAITFYPGLTQAGMPIMEKPVAHIEAAIKAKDSAAFTRAFLELTATCNSCHQSHGYGFIVIKVPTGSPHTNQVFTPQ